MLIGFIGFLIALIGALIPVLGIPFVIIGVILMIWGMFVFWIGVGRNVVKGVGTATGTASKKGTGRL